MSFLEEVERVQEKLPAQRLSRPMLVGIACIVTGIIVLTALGVASTARGDFIVGNSASSSSAAIESQDGGGALNDEPSNDDIAAPQGETIAPPSTCYVHIVGAVKNPGVYELETGARVDAVVSAAGGLTKSADKTAVNLARPVVDGEQIYIPEVGEQTERSAQEEVPRPPSDAAASSGVDTAKTNINSATESELESLPGIGEVMAGRIIESRESQGPFTSPEDLMRVSGIGEKKYASIADLITV